jgi:hypothetical protein
MGSADCRSTDLVAGNEKIINPLINGLFNEEKSKINK